MLDCRPSEIGWHFGKAEIKIKPGRIPFRCMHQMFRCIETFLTFLNLGQFFPHRFIHFDQITDSRTVNLQCLADWNILFS